MATPKVCVLRAPGTNCDIETAFSFELCGAAAERVHLFRLLENRKQLADYQILCIPGGFSYGDDIGAGVIFSRKLRLRVGDAILQFLQSDRLILGICNGFQVLLKSGILPAGEAGWRPAAAQEPQATLTWNDGGMYTAIWVSLAVDGTNSVFLRGVEEIELPVAHAEGKVAVRDQRWIERWRQNGQIALRYSRPRDEPAADAVHASSVLPYPHNPNGSIANIAGLSDPSGRVLGLMPHPERFIFATQHPRWTRLGLEGEGAGLKIFRNAVAYFA